MNSWTGTAQSLGSRSTGLLCSVIEFISKAADLLQGPSIFAGAVRCLAYEAADCGLLSPDLAAGIRRVKGVKKIDVRLGNWLTAEQSQRLWQAPGGERLRFWQFCLHVAYGAMKLLS